MCIELWGDSFTGASSQLAVWGIPHLHFCMHFVKLELAVFLRFLLVRFQALGASNCSPLIAVCGGTPLLESH